MKKLWIFSVLMSGIVTAWAQVAQPVTAAGIQFTAAKASLGMILLCCALVGFGLLTHVVTKLAELEQRGQPVGLKAYIAKQPFTALNVVLGAYGLLLLAYYTGEMGPVGSFCMGVAAQSAGDKMRARAKAKIEAISPAPPGA